MKPTTKVLIKLFSKLDSDDSMTFEFSKFRKTIEELPGMNYGITFRYAFPSIFQVFLFLLKLKFTLPIRILQFSTQRVRSTEGHIVYKTYISVVKTKVTSEINHYE